MSNTQNFNQSIKYSFPLIGNKSFKKSVYFLLSRLRNNKKLREFEPYSDLDKFYFKNLTILRDIKTCKKTYDKAAKDDTDFHLHNLNLSSPISMWRTYTTRYGDELTRYYGISLWFKNKETCHNFLKTLNIHRDEVCFAGYIDKYKAYEVVLRFSEGVTKNQIDNLLNIVLELYKRNPALYKNSKAGYSCVIPSTIYDRWFNPFDQKVLWKANEIRKTFGNTVNFRVVVKNALIYRYRERKNRRVESTSYGPIYSGGSAINYFISNKDRLPIDKIRENIYFVNHYLADKNPYKRKNARKDWKFAAEEYLNEIIGKILYKVDEYNEDIKSIKDVLLEHPTVDMETYGELIEDSKQKLVSYEAKLKMNPGDSDLERWVKFSADNIRLYSEIYDQKFNEAIEERKNLLKSRFNVNNITLFFSLKETKKFVEKLNLKTKISAIKLRKIVLDEFVKLNLFEVSEEYRSKVFCRQYLVLRKSIVNFYNKINTNLKYLLFIFKKFNYMLQNSISTKSLNYIGLVTNKIVLEKIFGPPD